MGAAIGLVVGEVTNPVQNAWMISRDFFRESAGHRRLSAFYTCFFTAMRWLVCPTVSADILVHLLLEQSRFGRLAGAGMALLCVGINVGGVWWAWKLCKGYYTEFYKRA